MAWKAFENRSPTTGLTTLFATTVESMKQKGSAKRVSLPLSELNELYELFPVVAGVQPSALRASFILFIDG